MKVTKTLTLYSLVLLVSTFGTMAYADSYPSLIGENGNTDCSPLAGWYAGLNGGYTYFKTTLRRPNPPAGIDQPHPSFPLTNPEWTTSGYDINPVLGYDFYTTYQIPIRLELSGNYFGKESRNENQLLLFLPTTTQSQTGPSQQVATDSFQAYDVMSNVYLDWHNSTAFTPFIGGGLGLSRIDTSHKGYEYGGGPSTAATATANHYQIAWDLATGVSYAMTNHLSLLAEVNYTDLGKVSFAVKAGERKDTFYSGDTLQSYSALAGIRYTF